MATRRKSTSGHPDPSLPLTPTPADRVDLTGRSIAVVGGTDGLGRALTRLAAARGARVIVVGRTFRDDGVPGLSFARADLASMREAERVARELPAETLDALVLTTGIFAAPQRQETEEGIERDLAVSYLSRFALVRGLAPRLGRDRPTGRPRPRIFVMGFPGAGERGDPDDLNALRGYAAFPVHMNTVAANEALVLDGAERYPELGIYGLNPGLVRSNIRANYLGEGSLRQRLVEAAIGLFMPSAEAYAARALPLLVAPELEGRSGSLFGPKGTAILRSDGWEPDRVARFVAASDALLARALDPGDRVP